MTLTEKWDKGELPEGDYYIKRRNGDFLYDNIDTSGVWRNSIDEDILEVLAPVPSYEEWQAKDKENKQLKELIKECREILDYAKDFAYHDPCCKCIAKINQVLGE